jgi:hypothetical protein
MQESLVQDLVGITTGWTSYTLDAHSNKKEEQLCPNHLIGYAHLTHSHTEKLKPPNHNLSLQ